MILTESKGRKTDGLLISLESRQISVLGQLHWNSVYFHK